MGGIADYNNAISFIVCLSETDPWVTYVCINAVHRYNSLIFQSLSTNEYGVIVGPKDLDSQNIWNLTTPALENCFTVSNRKAIVLCLFDYCAARAVLLSDIKFVFNSNSTIWSQAS